MICASRKINLNDIILGEKNDILEDYMEPCLLNSKTKLGRTLFKKLNKVGNYKISGSHISVKAEEIELGRSKLVDIKNWVTNT